MAARTDRCPRCLTGGFTVDHETHDGRPRFTCTNCRYRWTNGADGGEYMVRAKAKETR